MGWTGRRTLLGALGFVGGAAVGVVVLGGIGLVALGPSTGLLWGLAFLVSFVGMLFGIVAPLALVRYLGGRRGSRVAKQLSTAGGYAAIVVVTVGVAAAGFLLAPARLTANPLVGMVAFDAVGGAVLGGIVGRDAVSRRL